jgi:Tfp pilus assembly protein PilX
MIPEGKFGNQKGVAIIIAMVMLLVLTLIGLSSIFSTVYETKIAGNDRVGSAAFYAAVGGAEAGVSNLPSTGSYSGTLGSDESYRSGKMIDSGPQNLLYKGAIQNRGDDVTMWEYKRYQINATGQSYGATKEVEIQVRVGPYVTGTQYNN